MCALHYVALHYTMYCKIVYFHGDKHLYLGHLGVELRTTKTREIKPPSKFYDFTANIIY